MQELCSVNDEVAMIGLGVAQWRQRQQKPKHKIEKCEKSRFSYMRTLSLLYSIFTL